MSRYFAYGANMDQVHMATTAPGAVILGPATLPDHRVAIGRCGFGTLVDAPGHLVRGLLWNLTPVDRAALDRFEGVPDGLYHQAERVVLDQHSVPVRAMVYLAADSRPGRAEPSYLAQIVAAARALGFPAEYLSEVGRLPALTDDRRPGGWTAPSEHPRSPSP